jgi:hypothetical protein
MKPSHILPHTSFRHTILVSSVYCYSQAHLSYSIWLKGSHPHAELFQRTWESSFSYSYRFVLSVCMLCLPDQTSLRDRVADSSFECPLWIGNLPLRRVKRELPSVPPTLTSLASCISGIPLSYLPEDVRTGGWRILHNEELHNLYSSPGIIWTVE